MARNVKIFPFGKRTVQESEEYLQLKDSLSRTQILIKQAYGSFNHVNDRDLIESYVFEINALLCRYNYLLRRIKQLETEEESVG